MTSKTYSELSPYFSFKKCSVFIFIYIFLLIFLLGNTAIVIVLILKPQMPEFSVQKINVQSYKMDINNSNQNILVSSVSSLILNAENPNKVGLSYGPTRFHVISEGLVVGLIRVPRFHQPPQSRNVSVEISVSFECMNVSQLISSKDGNFFKIGMLGDVRTKVRILNVTLPKLKIVLDCEISVSHLSFDDGVHIMRWIKNNSEISVPLNHEAISKKCSVGILI